MRHDDARDTEGLRNIVELMNDGLSDKAEREDLVYEDFLHAADDETLRKAIAAATPNDT